MRSIRTAIVATALAIAATSQAHAQAAGCLIGGDPSQGYNVVWFDPTRHTLGFIGGEWAWAGPYDCETCTDGVTNVQSVGYQAACISAADESWYCDAQDGFWATSIEPNSSTNRAVFLLNLSLDPRYQPPSHWECYGNAGQYLNNPPYLI